MRWFYLDCPQYYVTEGDGGTNQQVTFTVYRRGDLTGTQEISKYIRSCVNKIAGTVLEIA